MTGNEKMTGDLSFFFFLQESILGKKYIRRTSADHRLKLYVYWNLINQFQAGGFL